MSLNDNFRQKSAGNYARFLLKDSTLIQLEFVGVEIIVGKTQSSKVNVHHSDLAGMASVIFYRQNDLTLKFSSGLGRLDIPYVISCKTTCYRNTHHSDVANFSYLRILFIVGPGLARRT